MIKCVNCFTPLQTEAEAIVVDKPLISGGHLGVL